MNLRDCKTLHPDEIELDVPSLTSNKVGLSDISWRHENELLVFDPCEWLFRSKNLEIANNGT